LENSIWGRLIYSRRSTAFAPRGMSAALQPANAPSATDDPTTGIMTPSPLTPRPNMASESEPSTHADDSTTPTRATFSSTAAGQKPLPSSPFPQAVQVPEVSDQPKRDSPHSAVTDPRRDSMDMDMDDSDGEAADDAGGSDEDSVNADGTRSSKKKKSQRFYCTEYPPCNLSFTRSEHLARHIRYV
jgi:C2H2 transcription facotor